MKKIYSLLMIIVVFTSVLLTGTLNLENEKTSMDLSNLSTNNQNSMAQASRSSFTVKNTDVNMSVNGGFHGSTVPGATITLKTVESDGQDDAGATITIAEDGTFTITDMLAGTFILNIALDGFLNFSQELTNTGLESTDLGHIHLAPVMVQGITIPFATVIIRNLVVGIEVRRINNIGSTGNFSISQLLDGIYNIEIIIPGFVPFTNFFEVNRQNVDLNILFEQELIETTAVSISGTAKPGSLIQLWELGVILEEIVVKEDGKFRFSGNIRNTVFELVALLETFETQRATIVVSDNASQVHNFNQSDFVTIHGFTSQRTTVSLFLDDKLIERIETDSTGAFIFGGLNNNTFRIVFERSRFNTISQNVTINYESVYLGTEFLTRTASENSKTGVIIQVTAVIGLFSSLWFIFREKKEKN